MVCRTKGFIFCSLLPAVACLMFWTPPLVAQEGTAVPKFGAAKEVPEKGYPIKDELIVSKCGRCHLQDAKGNMGRLSYLRTTPEGWEESMKRMIRLNGLQITPEEARKVLRYLADNQGLAPEEAAKIQYFNERRIQDETILPEKIEDVQHACASCHAFAKPLSWRRTPKEWDYLKAMHQAFFPSIDPSFSRQGRRVEGTEPKPEPVDVALDYIKKTAPLETTEWANWQGSVHTPKLAGEWLVTGYQPGKGKFYGKMTIAAGDGGMFSTKTGLTYANGAKFEEAGTALVYTGYAWRGHSKPATPGTDVDAPNNVREVMMLSRDENELKGRWFWGVYQEFGMEVTMHRAGTGGALMGTDIWSLKAGSSGDTLHIYGANLPQGITVADVDLGAGVTVSKVETSTPDTITVTASVDKAAIPGQRLIAVKGMTLPNAFVVYDHLDFLKVTPDTPMARLGSEPHAKGYAQCEAIAYSFGADGKPNTADDLALGPVPAKWSIEEFVASYGDDDIEFVGKMDEKTGLFTPASDGPNPKRKSMRNNYGDVWAVASYKPEGADKPMTGRAYMIVAVPEYMQWDQPEVGQ